MRLRNEIGLVLLGASVGGGLGLIAFNLVILVGFPH
jgi:hypothetical protein